MPESLHRHDPADASAMRTELDALHRQLTGTLADGLDHPEVWQLLAQVCGEDSRLAAELLARSGGTDLPAQLLAALLPVFDGPPAQKADRALAGQHRLESLMARFSQSPLVQGALFYCQSLLAPDDPRYRLAGKLCPIPFVELDVLESSCHLCCASWLPTSVGNLHTQDWQQVWNSASARAIRESVLDGSYRHCNKVSCPTIQGNDLIPLERLPDVSRPSVLELGGAFEYLGVRDQPIPLAAGWCTPVRQQGPAILNLSYDKTCNLSCPSCRSEVIAANQAERDRIGAMQEAGIKPLLAQASLAMITGSGDPFASKTFRQLLEWINPQTAPGLSIKLMTNGVLLDEREWQRFAGIHDKVIEIKVSIDGASAASHELLRAGSRWERLLPNLQFIGRLVRQHPRLSFNLAFIVQRDNFTEMGEAVELARSVGASALQFARLTNWGTFSDDGYRDRAVFLAGHPQHAAFLAALNDARLSDPIVSLGDLAGLRRRVGPDPHRLFPVAGDQRVCFLKNAIRNPNIVVGDYTYYDDPEPPQDFEHRNVLYHYPFIGDRLIIGKFCSLARGVRFIMNGANHATSSASNYLFRFFGAGWEHLGNDHQQQAYQRGDTVVGNDVWIGYEAMVMPGVTIGDGAVIAARAVVTRDVPPYAIVAGNPARLVRHRFDEKQVERLLAARWWDWSPERIASDLAQLVSADPAPAIDSPADDRLHEPG